MKYPLASTYTKIKSLTRDFSGQRPVHQKLSHLHKPRLNSIKTHREMKCTQRVKPLTRDIITMHKTLMYEPILIWVD